jgi:hypothetical protein
MDERGEGLVEIAKGELPLPPPADVIWQLTLTSPKLMWGRLDTYHRSRPKQAEVLYNLERSLEYCEESSIPAEAERAPGFQAAINLVRDFDWDVRDDIRGGDVMIRQRHLEA